MPKVLASLLKMCASSALRSNAFDGMHPTLRQTPPQYLGSTTAVFNPSCAARMAATYPPGPAPRTTASKCVTAPTLTAPPPPPAAQPFFDVVVVTAGDAQAAARPAGEPSAAEEHAGDRGGQRPGQGDAAIGPVDARAGEHSSACPQGGQVDAQLVKQILSAVGELMVPVVEGANGPHGQQPVAKLHAAASGQVVVARPRLEQATGEALLLQRANRSRRRNLGDGLQHRRHLRVDDLVVSMPPLH